MSPVSHMHWRRNRIHNIILTQAKVLCIVFNMLMIMVTFRLVWVIRHDAGGEIGRQCAGEREGDAVLQKQDGKRENYGGQMDGNIDITVLLFSSKASL